MRHSNERYFFIRYNENVPQFRAKRKIYFINIKIDLEKEIIRYNFKNHSSMLDEIDHITIFQ